MMPSTRVERMRRALPGTLKRAAVKTLVFTILALILMTALAWAGDPGGAATGTVKDVAAACAEADCAEPVAAHVGDPEGHPFAARRDRHPCHQHTHLNWHS